MTVFDTQMLDSIPKKLYAWLDSLGVFVDVPGHFNNLKWNFKEGYVEVDNVNISFDNASIQQEDEDGNSVTIFNVVNTRCNEPWTHDIVMNMDKFIELENKFYNVMEQLAVILHEAKKDHSQSNCSCP